MAKQVNQNGSTEVAEQPKKMLTKEELRKLFDKYDSANKVYDDAAAALKRAKEGRSTIVKAICDGAGSKGPFKHPKTGLQISGVERKNKETGESNWFFKGPGESDVIDLTS